MIESVTYTLLNANTNGLIEFALVAECAILISLGLMTLVAWALPEEEHEALVKEAK